MHGMIYDYNILARFFNTPIPDYKRQFGKSVQFYHFVMIMFALSFLKIGCPSVYLKMYVVRNILCREMLTCFYQKLLFPVTILSFLYSGV